MKSATIREDKSFVLHKSESSVSKLLLFKSGSSHDLSSSQSPSSKQIGRSRRRRELSISESEVPKPPMNNNNDPTDHISCWIFDPISTESHLLLTLGNKNFLPIIFAFKYVKKRQKNKSKIYKLFQ